MGTAGIALLGLGPDGSDIEVSARGRKASGRTSWPKSHPGFVGQFEAPYGDHPAEPLASTSTV